MPRKRLKGGHKEVVLSQIGIEIPENKYEDFISRMKKEGKIEVKVKDSNGTDYSITLFEAQYWEE